MGRKLTVAFLYLMLFEIRYVISFIFLIFLFVHASSIFSTITTAILVGCARIASLNCPKKSIDTQLAQPNFIVNLPKHLGELHCKR